MTEQANTPVLRFKSFNDEWSLSTIGALGDFYYGKSAPKWSITEDVGIPCIRYGELYTKFNNVVNEIYSYTSIPKEKLRFSKGGEILIPRVGEDPLDFAKCVYLPQKDIAIGEMISVYNTKENPLFLTYYFNTKMKYEFAKRVEGASVSNLYYSYLEDIKLKIPDIREQEKLGKFFSKLDRQIELEEEKLELLEQQKRGYMQKIFSQELRFKDDNGNDYPDWEETTLKNITNYISSKKSSNQYNESNNSEGYPVYDAIQEIGKDLQYDMKEPYISILKDGAGVGRLNLRAGKSSVIGTMGYIQANNVDIQFLYYRMKLLNFRKFIIGSTIPHLYYKDYSKEKILIPTSHDEQKKIGHFILNIDKLIDNKTLKLDYLKQRKQGLLQKMFV